MASSQVNVAKNPREPDSFIGWDGENAPVSEKAKKYAPVILIASALIVGSVVAFTPVREQQRENELKHKDVPVSAESNQPKMIISDKELVQRVLNAQGLFKPELLDSQP